MTVLVLGATGNTGSLVVRQLLDRDKNVKAIVRSVDKIPEHTRTHPRLQLVQANLLELSDGELGEHVRGCTHIVQCLGHNLNFQGIWGRPRTLVLDAIAKICRAIEILQPDGPIRFVLMNTNGALRSGERADCRTQCILKCLRCSLPPHLDNEMAADHLEHVVGKQSKFIEWVAVRPSNLTDDEFTGKYNVLGTQILSPIFGAEEISRANVAHFMCELTTDHELWTRWKFEFPVLVRKTS